MRELIEAVERGEFPHGVNGAARQVFPYHEDARADLGLAAAAAFDGSVDAALALMRAVLPGWTWVGGDMCEGMTVFPPGYDRSPAGHVDAYHPNPARALLLATLKAMEQTRAEA